MTSPTFEVSGSVVAFTDSGTATTFSVTPEAVTFDVVNVAGYTVAVTELDQLSDVDTSGVANGDALVYNSGTWVAGTVTGSGGTASVVLAGDVVGTAVAGTVTTDIAPSGVTAGTYGASGTAVVLTVGADGRITSIAGTAISGGGSSLPDPTGNGGAVLGTNGTAASWERSFTSPDGKSTVTTYDGYAFVDVQDGDLYSSASADSTGAEVYATDGTATAQVRANIDGTVEINATGAVTVTPGDGFHVVGSIGETFLTGDDWGMSTASDVPETAPGASSARARGDMETPTVVADGDALVYPVYAQGFDGTGQSPAAMIVAKVAGTVDTGKVPGLLLFATADADGVLTDRLVLNPDNTTELNGTLLDLDTSGASTGDVATWDGTKIVLDTPTGGGGGGGGGLVLIDSGTFSASSGVTLPSGAFDSAYDDFRLICVVSASSASDSLLIQLADSSGTPSTSSYFGGLMVANYGSPGSQVTTTSAMILGYRHSTTGMAMGVLDIFGPNLAQETLATGFYNSTTAGSGNGGVLNSWHVSATAYPRAVILPGSGTITGRWSLYGYAK